MPKTGRPKKDIDAEIAARVSVLEPTLGYHLAEKREVVLDLIPGGNVHDAQNLYMRYVPISKIAEITGLSEKVIRTYVNGEHGREGWKIARNELSKEVNEMVKQDLLIKLKESTSLGEDLIRRAFYAINAKHAQEGTEPSLDEAHKIAKIFDILFRNRLNEEKSDPTSGEKPLTNEQMLSAFQNDPFFKTAFLKVAGDNNNA